MTFEVNEMARNPKSDANLKPIKKGELSKEEAKKRGSNGGKKSGEVRRKKREAKQAAKFILDLAARGQLSKNLTELGINKQDQTNMVALQARLFTLAMAGDLDAYRELIKIAGYEPEENRKERESKASDRRRDLEVEAKYNVLNGKLEGADVAINSTDEDGNSDVVVYIPKMLDEKDCESEEEDENDAEENNETESSEA